MYRCVLIQSVHGGPPWCYACGSVAQTFTNCISNPVKYIKDDVYSAKNPLLNRDLSCHSAVKTKCVISAIISDVRKALHTGFE